MIKITKSYLVLFLFFYHRIKTRPYIENRVATLL